MRLAHQIVKAKDLEPDCFIYLPDEKRFFWVDDIDYDGKKVIFYFEEGVNKTGLVTFSIEMGENKKVKVIL